MTQFPGPGDQQPEQQGSGQPSYGQPSSGQPSYGPPPSGYGAAPPPAPGYGQPVMGGTPPPNYLVWAILATVLCCLPLGIVSIVFAAQVNGKYAAGDLAGAQDSSDKAKRFAIWSAIAAVVVWVLYILLFVMLGVLSSNS